MAFLIHSGLEKPGTGNPNTSGIVSGNTEILETWIDPATTIGDAGFTAIRRGLLKDGESVLTPAASVPIDMDAHPLRAIELDQNTTFTFTNLDGGQIVRMAVTNDGTAWTMTWPAEVVWVGPVAASSTIGKTGFVELYAFSASKVIGKWLEEL